MNTFTKISFILQYILIVHELITLVLGGFTYICIAYHHNPLKFLWPTMIQRGLMKHKTKQSCPSSHEELDPTRARVGSSISQLPLRSSYTDSCYHHSLRCTIFKCFHKKLVLLSTRLSITLYMSSKYFIQQIFHDYKCLCSNLKYYMMGEHETQLHFLLHSY